MPRKKYEQKNIENVNTLRLAVDFGKLYPSAIVDEAFYVLSTKKKKKASYITKAIEHYKKSNHSNASIRRALQRLNTAKKAKSLFNIDSEEKAIELLSTPIDSPAFQAISSSIPEHKSPTKMLLGFKIDDEQAIQTHAELYKMSANERILTISNAVVNYVLDGLDPEMDQIFATKFLLAAIKEYQSSKNKDAVLHNFLLSINFFNK